MLCRRGLSQWIAATAGVSRHNFFLPCHRRPVTSPIPKLAASIVCASYRVLAAATASRKKSIFGETGGDLLVEALEREGITDVFGEPTSSEDAWFSAALERSKKIRFSNHIRNDCFSMNGDKALVAAMTYAHLSSTGLPAVCCVSSVHKDCWKEVALSKIPVVIILTDHSEFDSNDIAYTKGRFRVLDVPDIPRVVKQAFSLASSGPRPGPVVINISSELTLPTADDESLLYNKFRWEVSYILFSKRPVLYMDGGCLSRSSEEVRRFMELTGGMPLASNFNGLSSYLHYHNDNGQFSLQMLGDGCVDYAVRESDLLLLFGIRYNDDFISQVVKENRDMEVIHIIEDGEKLPEIQEEEMYEYIPVFSDVKLALQVMNEMLEMEKTVSLKNPDFSAWMEDCYFTTSRVSNFQDKSIEPHHVTQILNELTNCGVAKLIISASGIYKKPSLVAEFYEQIKPDECLDGWEAAIGAAVFSSSVPDSPIVVHIDAFRWSKSRREFGLSQRVTKPKNLPIKIITIDYKCRNPLDWTELSEINDMPRACVMERAELRDAIKKMLATPGSYFLQVVVIPKPVVSNRSSTAMSVVNGILV